MATRRYPVVRSVAKGEALERLPFGSNPRVPSVSFRATIPPKSRLRGDFLFYFFINWSLKINKLLASLTFARRTYIKRGGVLSVRGQISE